MITLLLALLYPIAVQYERGGLWRIVAPFTLVALILDVIANWTELSLALWQFPRANEYTFSSRLERLVCTSGWRSNIARRVARALNYIYPNHIRAIQP